MHTWPAYLYLCRKICETKRGVIQGNWSFPRFRLAARAGAEAGARGRRPRVIHGARTLEGPWLSHSTSGNNIANIIHYTPRTLGGFCATPLLCTLCICNNSDSIITPLYPSSARRGQLSRRRHGKWACTKLLRSSLEKYATQYRI